MSDAASYDGLHIAIGSNSGCIGSPNILIKLFIQENVINHVE